MDRGGQSAQGRRAERSADCRASGQSRAVGQPEGRLSKFSGSRAPRLLVTGFGPFPSAPENPTGPLVASLVEAAPETFGAAVLRAIVLPTEYHRSWTVLRGMVARFAPDVVIHFGLSRRAEAIMLECSASRRLDPERPDAAGTAPASGVARRSGPEVLASTLPCVEIALALQSDGIPTQLSHDAGAYVCNATLYRSLAAARRTPRMVGLIHVPPAEGQFAPVALARAAAVAAQVACQAWSSDVGQAL